MYLYIIKIMSSYSKKNKNTALDLMNAYAASYVEMIQHVNDAVGLLRTLQQTVVAKVGSDTVSIEDVDTYESFVSDLNNQLNSQVSSNVFRGRKLFQTKSAADATREINFLDVIANADGTVHTNKIRLAKIDNMSFGFKASSTATQKRDLTVGFGSKVASGTQFTPQIGVSGTGRSGGTYANEPTRGFVLYVNASGLIGQSAVGSLGVQAANGAVITNDKFDALIEDCIIQLDKLDEFLQRDQAKIVTGTAHLNATVL